MKRTVFSLVFLLVMFSLTLQSVHSASPFRPGPAQKEEPVSSGVSHLLPAWVRDTGGQVMGRLLLWQAQIRQKAGGYAREIRENPWGSAFWSYMGLAFLYGVVHAFGPGHGKVFVSTYFLSRKGRVAQAFLMGGLMGFFHVFSALVLVLFFYFIMKSGGMASVDGAGRSLQQFSAAMIALVGFFLVWRGIKALFDGEEQGASGCLASSHADTRSLFSLSLAVGMVPCPGAALILFFSLSLDILLAGVLAMVFLAAGLSFTTSLFALLALFARKAMGHGRSEKRRPPFWHQLPPLAGAVCITLLGIFLFFNPH